MAKQADLIEGRGIKEIDEAADILKKSRDKRIKMLRSEMDAAEVLLSLMKKQNRQTYIYDGYEVKVVSGKEKVKVRVQKDEDEEHEE